MQLSTKADCWNGLRKTQGLVNHYYTCKNKDESLQEKELEASGLFDGISFADKLNLDKALDYGELFELASMTTFAEIEKVSRIQRKIFFCQEPVFLRQPQRLALPAKAGQTLGNARIVLSGY